MVGADDADILIHIQSLSSNVADDFRKGADCDVGFAVRQPGDEGTCVKRKRPEPEARLVPVLA